MSTTTSTSTSTSDVAQAASEVRAPDRHGTAPEPALAMSAADDPSAGTTDDPSAGTAYDLGGSEEAVVDTATLLDRDAPRPTHRSDLADELRRYIEDELRGPEASALRGQPKALWVSKATYSAYAACEAYGIARRAEEFSWSEPAVLGTVTDRAIAKVLGTTTAPAEAVEQVLAVLEAAHDNLAGYLGAWVATRCDWGGRGLTRHFLAGAAGSEGGPDTK
jgi:hypothetical protein